MSRPAMASKGAIGGLGVLWAAPASFLAPLKGETF